MISHGNGIKQKGSSPGVSHLESFIYNRDFQYNFKGAYIKLVSYTHN